MGKRTTIGKWSSVTLNAARAAGLGMLLLGADEASSQTFKVLHGFGGSDGRSPFSGLVLCGSNLFGTTVGGGAGYGTLFKINTDGTAFGMLTAFPGSDGPVSYGNLTLSGTTLYGTTYGDGISRYGSVFKINTDGSGYSVLRRFTGDDGSYPGYAELVLSDGVLYGTTWGNSHYSSYSTVFKMNIDSSGYTVLRQFAGSPAEGSWTRSGLLLIGRTLYGTTTYGGLRGDGTVFKVNTDGSGYTTLHHFGPSSPDGSYPYAGLVASADGTLYGTTSGGGVYTNGLYGGTVFKIQSDGTGYAVLRSFTGLDGREPWAGLTLSGNTLFGTTYGSYQGGISNLGTVFKLNTDGTGFSVLKYFTGSDGANPQAGVVLFGDTLFGTTDYGGSANFGVVFSLSLPVSPTITRWPQSQTVEVGGTVSFASRVTGTPPLSYQWFFNDLLLTGLTTPRLQITNVGPANCGVYTLVITNAVGAATSAPAMLSVIPPVERRPVPALTLLGQTGAWLNIDAVDAAKEHGWLALDCVALTNAAQDYFDVSSPLPSQRFYRAWHTNVLSAPAALELRMVPAITVTGLIGDSVRLDYISAIGPTDAWMTLDKVTLTGTSQLYFDVSAPGQSQRLYRCVRLP